MKYEGVNFNEEVIRQLSLEEFIDLHLGILWPDKDKEVGRKMLEEAYGLIAEPPATKKGRKKAKE